MESKLSLNINSRLYLRNPEETELGQRIIAQSVDLIEAIGIELFTFKKLATNINSTEASIYRYFENKHNLLIYLISVHWVLKEEQLQAQLQKLNTQKEKLEAIISVLVAVPIEFNQTSYSLEKLSRIVQTESDKALFTKQVDEDNRQGYFIHYKSFCLKIASVILEFSPEYAYSRSLATMLVETANHQFFFSAHLPSLTNLEQKNYSNKDFLRHLLQKVLA